MNDKSQYVCVMFPYPSGSGLHLGHYYNYAVMDTYCRWMRHCGTEVFQPFGYDAFGLPAELYAKSVGRDPASVTDENINNFRTQIDSMNTQYEERLVTSSSDYYRWTQWLFLKMVEWGLAYRAEGEVNWCPECETVLANEQAQGGMCERHGIEVEKRVMTQWYFAITKYRDRLIKNLNTIDYPVGTIKQQRDWLENLHDWCVSRQRSWGCPIPLEGETDTLDTFVDSSFYFHRYLTNSDTEFLPKDDYRPVDLYVGGPEHACMHLLYARFINMVLFDHGYVGEEEPFRKVVHQGMITRDGHKMSKSKGNAISPDGYDPDELRMYLMFIGPYRDGGDWSDQHIVGIRRFLNRMRVWLGRTGNDTLDLTDLRNRINRSVADFKFNTVVSSLMEFMNKNKNTNLTEECRDEIVTILRVFAPAFVISD